MCLKDALVKMVDRVALNLTFVVPMYSLHGQVHHRAGKVSRGPASDLQDPKVVHRVFGRPSVGPLNSNH